MAGRDDIYKQEGRRLPRRRKASSSQSDSRQNASGRNAGAQGFYGARERRSTIGDDLSGRGKGVAAQPAGRAPTPRRRRRSARSKGGNKWVLILLVAILVAYMGILGASLYRSFFGEEEEEPTPVLAEEEPEETPEAAPADPVPDDPAEIAAQDAERTGEYIDAWRSALNAMYRAETTLARGGETERAMERLEEAIDEAPHVVDLQLALADMYVEQQRYAEARDLYVRVLQADPMREGVRLKWARTLHALRHHEAALQVALWILDDDGFLEEPNQIAAMAYLAMDRIEAAIPHLRRQVAVDRDNIVAQNNLAVAYSRLGEYGRAVTLFRDVLEADPSNAITYYNLAVCHAQQGDADEAVETLQDAAERFGLSFVRAWFRSEDFDPIRDSTVFQELESLNQLPGDNERAQR